MASPTRLDLAQLTARDEDRRADALAEQQDDAAWARHDAHVDSGQPTDDDCAMCRFAEADAP